jgi:hypothetical protein
MTTKTIYLLAIGCILTVLSACTTKPKQLNEKEVVRLAEEFVKINGYTQFKPDGSNFEFEVSDDLIHQNIPATLEKRYNSLQPNAICILQDKVGWHVGFLRSGIDFYKLDSTNKLPDLPGRMVNVYTSGEIRMSQKEPHFSNFIPLK